jgi:excinuclease ABC subunit A
MTEIMNDIIDSDDNFENELSEISVSGAREHNLKNINIKIPRDKFIVITGLSGSGKSSLAFDTIYAEGQRRYVECLSPYAKQYLGMMKKPDVDRIEGLSPSISIEQKSISHSPRSTVGTTTEIYDYLRLLYAKIGIQYCVDCDLPVIQKTGDQIISEIFTKHLKKKVIILSPLVKARKGHYRELFEVLIRQGFTKVRVDSKVKDLKEGMKLDRYSIHDIELVIDKCVVDISQEHRIIESVDLALKRGEGTMSLLYNGDDDNEIVELYSTHYACPNCAKAYEKLAPNMFSFNSPYGACPKCQGIGTHKELDITKIFDKEKSIEEGGILPLTLNKNNWVWIQLHILTDYMGINTKIPIKDLPKKQIEYLFNPEEYKKLSAEVKINPKINMNFQFQFEGLNPLLKHQYENANNTQRKVLEQFFKELTCNECNGGRLKKENLAVKVYGFTIQDICSKDIDETLEIAKNITTNLNDREQKIANIIFNEITARLEFLQQVGLTYLSLGRNVNTLSGGESQRIRLASQIGSKLVGITYVLDEPSIGLHQHDNDKLITSLKNLRDLGNTVLVVEHDKAMIEHSDHFIDIGPGAGIHGGEIILEADPKEIKNLSPEILEKSLTAKYLLNIKRIEIPEERRSGNGNFLSLKGCKGNNLNNVDLQIPLGKFVCITGMSGSGKSSLINDTLYPILAHFYFNNNSIYPLEYSKIEGLDFIDKVIEIDQSPIGRTPRSNPATYTGLFTYIRDYFAMLPESRIRGYKSGRFSFNVEGGRCEECQGAGIKKIEMNFLPDVYVKCDSCEGKRYNSETLTVKYNGKSISNVLDMTVEEANEFFTDIPKLKKILKTLFEVGLGYITLGQQAPTLSGGEAQRVKLATELAKTGTGKTLYLLDEPTTGLHFEDINVLLKLLQKLVDKGNTVVVIEHNLDVIKCADWIIDLGPYGGKNGGKIIAEGTPETIVKTKKSITGRYLKAELSY